jgi:hypothetical protein
MNQYLLADGNREAVQTHNENLVVTTTKQVGQASYVSHDFNREEEFRQLDRHLSIDDPTSLTVANITTSVYGADDDALRRRVRSSLRYGSGYQKTLRNGRAVIAKADGTLRITASPDEFGDLVEENTAAEVASLAKSVQRRTAQLNRKLAAAIDKVPELHDRLADTRREASTSLGSLFSRQLELLSGAD